MTLARRLLPHRSPRTGRPPRVAGGCARAMRRLAACLAPWLPAVALASTPVPVLPVPPGTARVLQVPVSGFVSARCIVRQPQSAGSFGDILDRANGSALAQRLTLTLAVSCNAPFEAVVTSQSGGLAFEGEPAPGFAAIVPYAMTLDLPAAGAALACESAAMRSAPGQDQSACRRRIAIEGTAAGNATLRLSTRAGGLPLLMGQYSDTITLRFSPRLGS